MSNETAEAISDDVKTDDVTVDDGITIDGGSEDSSSTETVDGGSAEPQKVEFSEDQQKVFDTAIATQGLKNKKSESENLTLRQQLTDLQNDKPQPTRPLIPEMPDKFDDDFASKMSVRDKAIQEASAFDTGLIVSEQIQKSQVAAAQKVQSDALNETAKTFVGRAGPLGVNENQLQQSIASIEAFGGIGEVAEYVMSDENGPLIAAYLAENPAEVLTLQQLSSLQGVAHIVSKVSPKAVAMKRTTNVPSPADSLGGAGATPSDEGPEGATYE